MGAKKRIAKKIVKGAYKTVKYAAPMSEAAVEAYKAKKKKEDQKKEKENKEEEAE